MMIISEPTIRSPLYYLEHSYKIILIGEFCIDNEIIGVKDRTGYFISNTQYSNYIQPYNETECNGFEKQKGNLFNFDLQYFSISNSLREYIKSLNDQVCLYEFRIYRKGIKDVIGWLIERKNGQITIEVNNYNMGHYLKRYKALEFCKSIIEEKRF